MSIWLYTGTPGSGKSFHAAKDIVSRLKRPGGIIANFPINEDFVPEKKRRSSAVYWDNSELTAKRLVEYALEHHKIGVEGQTMVIIDECQIIFNCRDFGRKDRGAWVTLFSQHRKLGYNFILITQNDRMLDKQIRALVETEVRHRKLNNYGFGGLLISLTGMTWFVAIEYWYGGNKLMERKVKNMTTSKTVRLDDRVIKYIEAYRGDNFSDKLRNYVLEHEERRDQIVDDWNRLQAQVSDKHEEMKMLQDRVRRLREVDARLKPLVDAVLGLIDSN